MSIIDLDTGNFSGHVVNNERSSNCEGTIPSEKQIPVTSPKRCSPRKVKRMREFTYLRDALGRIYLLQGRWLTLFPWKKALKIDLTEYVVPLSIILVDKHTNLPVFPEKNFTLMNYLTLNVKTVLVTGNVGFGKTTYCSKLAYDWAKENVDKRHNTNFTFLIHFPLANYTYNAPLHLFLLAYIASVAILNVEDTARIFRQTFLRLWKFIIVLDGYDELDYEKQKLLKQFICKPGWPFQRSVIIVTSRETKDDEFLNSFDKRFHIEGVSENSARIFIEKFFICDEDKKNSFKKMLETYSDNREARFSPLLLIYFCNAFCPIFQQPKGSTESLLITFISDVVRRCNITEKLNLNEEQVLSITRSMILVLHHCKLSSSREINKNELLKILGKNYGVAALTGILKLSSTDEQKCSFEVSHSLLLDLTQELGDDEVVESTTAVKNNDARSEGSLSCTII